ncbi:hypothetical protein SK128_010417 [Halocaridina rubra]|uniref:Ionotropic glutamate receptor C-terminal domain-containing protein n=1 Tax=Halocaridina rubra TaxID=373956 RepID=A0AAN8WQP4_HALRR
MHLAKSHDQVPKRTSTQVYIAFLYIYCFILTVVYSTNLTAYLTVKKAPKSMETIQEVHDSGVHLVGMDDFFEKMLGSSPDPNLQKLPPFILLRG